MSRGGEQSLFFLNLPDLRKLCCVTLCLESEEGEVRNKQMKTCRELLLLYADIVASPVLGSFSEIIVIMGIAFFKRGIIHAYVQRHSLQMGSPQRVLPGRDFLTDPGKLNAIVMELSASESQLCVSVEASTVRLPPTRLEDFDVPPMVLRNFHSQPDAVIQTFSMSSSWCYILPSMKRGQIVRISQRMPNDCPFQGYSDIQNHWNSLYGYQLPQMDEEEVIYCSVYFKLVGERLFTYPLSCVRTEPLQRCPRVDLQGVLSSFLSRLREILQTICGFPVRMTSRPCYHTAGLLSTASAKMASGKPVNLTTKSASRPIQSQLPPPGPLKPSFSGAACTRTLRLPMGQSSNNSFLGTGRTQGVHPTPPQGNTPERGLPVLNPSPAPLPHTRHPQHSQVALTAPKMVPIFKNKALPCHVSVNQLLAEKFQMRAKEQQQAIVSRQKRPCPAFTSSSSSSSSSSFSSVPHSLFSSFSSERTQDAYRSTPVSVSRIPPCPKSEGFPTYHSQGDLFEWKPKKPKSAVQDVDVEKHARGNQLSKINAATLQAWLKSRGVAVRSKERKEELVSKVMGCLSEL
ncbi:uncharacterized protein C18orf63 isoform X1 [Esox lucius]|uniref:uncharacterized protein C18orf63 isoform X1 n=1 Tax=Esox lucius TaxID=8010 RepID=UPI001476AEC4|nr:uncharacterized protein C18orf63 isoform X1 [Esox lucius]